MASTNSNTPDPLMQDCGVNQVICGCHKTHLEFWMRSIPRRTLPTPENEKEMPKKQAVKDEINAASSW